jgi:hypothetical protein
VKRDEMIVRWAGRQCLLANTTYATTAIRSQASRFIKLSTRQYATSQQDEAAAAAARTRNIGIIAHIDAVCERQGPMAEKDSPLTREKQPLLSACFITVVSLAELEVSR